VLSGLRHPRRLTVLAIANETALAVFYVLRAARAVQRRRPRIAELIWPPEREVSQANCVSGSAC